MRRISGSERQRPVPRPVFKISDATDEDAHG
jgi:hypothetical protein